jgi:hypothetical protein
MDEINVITQKSGGPEAISEDLLSKILAVFLTSSVFIYVALGVATVNLPRYYPALHKFSVTPIADQVSMGFYGRVVFALIGGILITLLFAIYIQILNRLGMFKPSFSYGIMLATVWFGAAIIVFEEWHVWGIEKRELAGGGILNAEFGLLMIGVLIMGVGVLLTAGALRRGVVLSNSSLEQK